MRLPAWFHRFGSPPYVFRLAERLRPWLGWLAVLAIVVGAFSGLVVAPADYLQGDGFRIFYVHVPSVYLAMMAYMIMASAAAIGFIWRLKVAYAVAIAIAPVGAWITALGLVTGSIWGKPMWGTYWQWGDARLVSWLVLLFLYLGYLALHGAFEDRDKADRASAILAVVGVVNIPIIHFSVEWWTTLHQGPTIARIGTPAITMDMLWPFLFMLVGFQLLFFWLMLTRLQGEILEREQDARWINDQALGGRA
jgi:heme exporter protein C